ncbi:MAG: TetR family transcriptional regulator [Proteobacteria bacterium]|nr:TetR family transcriptional regulator [Pseudomonadota bacterium]
MKKSSMRISDLITRTGVPRTTIHYYLRSGLLHAPDKTGKTMGYYNESHVARLNFISKMKKNLPGRFIKKMIANGEMSGKESFIDPRTDGEDSPLRSSRLLRKKQIIRGGVSIISQKGYRTTTINDITHALGISTGAFYIYFKNKQELFEAVVTDVLEDINTRFRDAIMHEKDPLNRMFIRAHVFYANYQKYSEIINCLRSETSRDVWAGNMVKKAYEDMTKPLIEEVRSLINAGIFRDIEPELFSYTMVGIIEMMSLRMTFDEKYSYEEIDRFLLDMIVKRFPYIPPDQSALI